MIVSLFTMASLAVAQPTPPSPACSIGELRQSPGYRWRVERIEEMVDSATRIVRVRAVAADSLARTVTFQPLEWLRGASVLTVSLPGIAVERDDLNSGSVPYQIVRSAGQRGDCFAQEYRLGAQYLLLLRDQAGGNPIQWWPLAPVNEQLRGDDDAWLAWVRRRVAHRSSSRGGALHPSSMLTPPQGR
jgi:hypothetical protein